MDTAKFWTFIDQEKFQADGVVESVELYAEKSGRPLKVGIFRRQSNNPCDYKLMQQITLTNLKAGKNKVKTLNTMTRP